MNRERSFPLSHYELNYLVSEEAALNVRDFIRSYIEMDELSIGRPNYSFPSHTLYLDSEDLALYWKAINDSEHRCELRMRTFSSDSGAPVYLEIKRRVSAIVLRERCAVRPEAIDLVLTGQLPNTAYLVDRTPANIQILLHFLKLKETLHATPKLLVAYLREAYTTWDEKVRVTLDRQIMCQASSEAIWPLKLNSPCPIFHGTVLLELNFPDRYPNWFVELVRVFNLMECEADKFVTGMSAIGSKLSGPPANRPFDDLPFE